MRGWLASLRTGRKVVSSVESQVMNFVSAGKLVVLFWLIDIGEILSSTIDITSLWMQFRL